MPGRSKRIRSSETPTPRQSTRRRISRSVASLGRALRWVWASQVSHSGWTVGSKGAVAVGGEDQPLPQQGQQIARSVVRAARRG